MTPKCFIIFVLFALAAIVPFSSATQYSIHPTQTSVEINAVIAALLPGDELLVHAGVYANVALQLINLRGTADAWITIRGVPCGSEKPLFSLDTNVVIGLPSIHIGSGCEFIKIEGLKFTHSGNGLVAGVLIDVNVNDIILDGLHLDTINGIGIDLFGRNNIANIIIRGCVLVNIGRIGIAANVGVGIAVGGLNVAVTGVANIQLLNNVIHDVFGWEGAAIKVCLGVSAVKILDNVIWNCPRGIGPATVIKAAIHVATGITVGVDALALIARNLIVDSVSLAASANIALRLGAGTQCVNNIVINADIGIDLILAGSVSFQNTLIAHNTIHLIKSKGIRCKNFGIDANIRIINNVISVGGLVGTVLDLVGALLGTTRGIIVNNICIGPLGLGGLLGGLLRPGAFVSVSLSLNQVFAAVGDALVEIDLLPGGPLLVDVSAQIGASVQAQIAAALGGVDFDGNVRVGAFHCGAYQANAGPHWKLDYGMKGIDVAAQVEIPCVASVEASVNTRSVHIF